VNGTRRLGQRRIGLTAIAAAALALGGCATKDWVRDYVAQQDAPISASVQKVDGRVTAVDGRVSQVATQTAEARKVADAGMRKADGVDMRVTQALNERQNLELVDSKSLRFATGKVVLLPDHKQVLDDVHALLIEHPTYSVHIIAEADRPGTRHENDIVSLRREENVRRYIAEKGDVVLHRIYFIALGEDLADKPKPQPEHREVTVAIYRPMAQ